jgi:hypothetical protein
VRYALFFRLYHADFDRADWQAPMRDIWMHWPGIRDAINSQDPGNGQRIVREATGSGAGR